MESKEILLIAAIVVILGLQVFTVAIPSQEGNKAIEIMKEYTDYKLKKEKIIDSLSTRVNKLENDVQTLAQVTLSHQDSLGKGFRILEEEVFRPETTSERDSLMKLFLRELNDN